MPQSSVAWIDFSEQDRRKMMEVVSLFKQRDTRDELVSQDPDDEPASALLERIRAGQET